MPDIETLVGALPDESADVVAGRNGLRSRRVARTTVVSSASDIAAAEDHALLVTTTESLADDIGASGVRQAGDGVAGICVVGLGSALPPALLSAADDLDLPLIVFAGATRTDTAVIAILEALLAISEAESQLVTEERFAAITLEDLVSTDPIRNAEAIERAVNLGWDLHQPRAVLLASIDPPVEPSVARRSLTTIAAAARATLGQDAILWQRSTVIAALLASASQDGLHDFVLHAIGPLLEHDDRHQAELVATLSTWLETRNMAEASRQMYVHYNTFKNRLERIEAILGPVLDDAARLLECEVAIYIARHYDGPWKHPAA